MQQKYYADMSTDEDGTTSDNPILMEPPPLEGDTTTPEGREKLARQFGRDMGTVMREMRRPKPPYPDDADDIRAGIEKITDAEGQEEMLRAWRGYVDGDPKAEKVIRLWVDGGGLFDAPAPIDTPPPPLPAREPAPKAPRKPRKPRTTVVEPEPMMEIRLWDRNAAGRRARADGASTRA